VAGFLAGSAIEDVVEDIHVSSFVDVHFATASYSRDIDILIAGVVDDIDVVALEDFNGRAAVGVDNIVRYVCAADVGVEADAGLIGGVSGAVDDDAFAVCGDGGAESGDEVGVREEAVCR